jgi:hypothetical protein
VTLLCLKNARTGGLSSWSSSISVHNEILRRRPDLGPVLAGPWCVPQRGHRGQPGRRYDGPVHAVTSQWHSLQTASCRVVLALPAALARGPTPLLTFEPPAPRPPCCPAVPQVL